jgi:hypothetical protein
MSASRRKLTRLPLEIFQDLQGGYGGGVETEGVPTTTGRKSGSTMPPEELRRLICERLQRFRARLPQPYYYRSSTKTVSISLKTVGDLLRVSPRTILHALDPLLTHGTFFFLLLWSVGRYSERESSSVRTVNAMTFHATQSHQIPLLLHFLKPKSYKCFDEFVTSVVPNLSTPRSC